MDDFKEIPILDLDLIYSESTYNQFLTGLQDALMRVGSFYLKGHDISDPVWDAALAQSRAFFELPLEQKLEIETVKSRHFLGYNRAEVETTSGYGESIAVCPLGLITISLDADSDIIDRTRPPASVQHRPGVLQSPRPKPGTPPLLTQSLLAHQRLRSGLTKMPSLSSDRRWRRISILYRPWAGP